MDKIDCRPKVELLKALAASRLDVETALGEWIDNALDAGATSIAVVASPSESYVSIADNGAGCPTLENFAILGDHSAHKTTRLGRYGIGSKDAALWLGGEKSTLAIVSTHGAKRRRLTVNWESMARDGWRIDQPEIFDAAPSDRGTQLEVTPIVRKLPSGADWTALLQRLGFTYSPALKRGAQITMHLAVKRKASAPTPIPRWEMPPLEEVIDRQIVVGGHTARVYAGIVKEGHPNTMKGLHYVYDYRVVMASRGCGGFNISRVCGFVDLDNSWPLSKNKDGLSSKSADDLFAAVENALSPMLELAQKAGMQLESHAFEERVSERLNALLGAKQRDKTAKAVRKPRENETGTESPTGAGAKHTQAQQEQEGETFPARGGRRGGYSIVHEPRGDPGHIGELKERVIYLNSDNPCVREARDTGNELATVAFAASVCAAVHCFEDPKKPGQRLLIRSAPQSDFGKAMGMLLSGDVLLNGKRPSLAAVPR